MPKWVFDMPMFVAPTYSCNPFSAMEKLLGWWWGGGGMGEWRELVKFSNGVSSHYPKCLQEQTNPKFGFLYSKQVSV